MQRLKQLHEAYTAWVQRTKWVHRPMFIIINGFLIILGFIVIVYIPAVVLLGVMKASGFKAPDGSEALAISALLKATLAACIFFVAIVSGATAGLMRSLFRGGMFDLQWIMLAVFAASVSLFLYVSFAVRQITTALNTVGGDTPTIVAFLTGWLLLLGYTAKVPWDEFRDRCAALFDGKWELRQYWDQRPENATTAAASTDVETPAEGGSQNLPKQ
ncbi:hypothetical protein [Sphingomonas sp. SAFR-052]|uniref:hypothetical protein n=1 Tax=Sphingomonas sp. SAFR-052 TaxID=3436867 RepID=UPI003F7DBEFD